MVVVVVLLVLVVLAFRSMTLAKLLHKAKWRDYVGEDKMLDDQSHLWNWDVEKRDRPGRESTTTVLWDLQEKKMCRVESLATRNFLDLAWYERILP